MIHIIGGYYVGEHIGFNAIGTIQFILVVLLEKCKQIEALSARKSGDSIHTSIKGTLCINYGCQSPEPRSIGTEKSFAKNISDKDETGVCRGVDDGEGDDVRLWIDEGGDDIICNIEVHGIEQDIGVEGT